MASRYEVELTLTSATDLKNINWRHGPIKPYAVAWVDPDGRKVTTRVDDEGDTCPNWNQTIVVPFDRPIEDSTLRIDIVHAYPADDVKPLIGAAKLHLRDVVDDAGIGGRATRRLPLKRPSGRPHGKLEVQVAVKDTRYRSPDPYAPPYGTRDTGGAPYAPPSYGASYAPPSYGAAPPPYGQPAPAYGSGEYGQPAGYGSGSGYGQPGGYGSGYGQPAGYGSGGYGQPVEEKKSKFGGMGMGTGLAVGAVAGALGGLALAEGIDKFEDHVADQAAEKVEDDLDDGDYGDDDGW